MLSVVSIRGGSNGDSKNLQGDTFMVIFVVVVVVSSGDCLTSIIDGDDNHPGYHSYLKLVGAMSCTA